MNLNNFKIILTVNDIMVLKDICFFFHANLEIHELVATLMDTL